jgi:hypothetical protein
MLVGGQGERAIQSRLFADRGPPVRAGQLVAAGAAMTAATAMAMIISRRIDLLMIVRSFLGRLRV